MLLFRDINVRVRIALQNYKFFFKLQNDDSWILSLLNIFNSKMQSWTLGITPPVCGIRLASACRCPKREESAEMVALVLRR